MAFDYYDVQAAGNMGAGSQISPEERQMRRTRRLISAAENTNYDGDPEFYQQIKGLALQAGVPIKSFKTNPFRLAKTGLLSALDTALFGLLPNDLYTPMNEAERMAAGVGSVAGMVVPWGGPARAFQAGKAMLGGAKLGKTAQKGLDAFMRRKPKPTTVGASGGTAGTGNVPISPLQAGAGTTGKPPAWQAQSPTMGGVPAPNAANVMPKVGKPTINLKPKVKKSQQIKQQGEQLTLKPTGQTKPGPKQGPKDASFSFKMNNKGVPSKGELAKIKGKMTPKERKSLKKLKGKQRSIYLQGWAQKHGFKVIQA